MLISLLIPVERAAALAYAIRRLVEINLDQLQSHKWIPRLYEAGVIYQREPVGQEDWQSILTTLDRGYGDCEDLAAWRVAELIYTGEDRRARPRLERHGRMWHVTVLRGDGKVEDPSKRLGMPYRRKA